MAEAAAAVDPQAAVPALTLPRELGQQMAQQWSSGEAAYLATMAHVFAQLRAERTAYPGHYAAVRGVYLTYLQRPALDKQQKVRQHLDRTTSLCADGTVFCRLEARLSDYHCCGMLPNPLS